MSEDGDDPTREVSNSASRSDGQTTQAGSIVGDVTVNHNRWTAIAYLSALVAFLAVVVAVIWLVHDKPSPLAGTTSAQVVPSTSVSTPSTPAPVPMPVATSRATCGDGIRAVVDAPAETPASFDYKATMLCPPDAGQEYRLVIEFPREGNQLDHTGWYAQHDRLPPDLTTFTKTAEPSGPGSTRLIYVISCDPADYDEWSSLAPLGKPITGKRWPGVRVSEPVAVVYRP